MIADIVAQDSKGYDVLVAVVTGSSLAPQLTAQYFEILERECPSIPFGMVVDLEEIHIKKLGCEPRPCTVCTLSAREVFSRYDPEYGSKRIFHHYLVTLADVWLHDLARRWTSAGPPGISIVAELGLLERLERGETQREVPLGIDSLR